MNTFFSVEPFFSCHSWLPREDGFCLHYLFLLLNNGVSDFMQIISLWSSSTFEMPWACLPWLRHSLTSSPCNWKTSRRSKWCSTFETSAAFLQGELQAGSVLLQGCSWVSWDWCAPSPWSSGSGRGWASLHLKVGMGVQRDISVLEAVEQRNAKTHNSYFEYCKPKYHLPDKLWFKVTALYGLHNLKNE